MWKGKGMNIEWIFQLLSLSYSTELDLNIYQCVTKNPNLCSFKFFPLICKSSNMQLFIIFKGLKNCNSSTLSRFHLRESFLLDFKTQTSEISLTHIFRKTTVCLVKLRKKLWLSYSCGSSHSFFNSNQKSRNLDSHYLSQKKKE